MRRERGRSLNSLQLLSEISFFGRGGTFQVNFSRGLVHFLPGMVFVLHNIGAEEFAWAIIDGVTASGHDRVQAGLIIPNAHFLHSRKTSWFLHYPFFLFFFGTRILRHARFANFAINHVHTHTHSLSLPPSLRCLLVTSATRISVYHILSDEVDPKQVVEKGGIFL